MGKEFIETTVKGPTIGAGIDEICDDLFVYARKYIKSDRPVISDVSPVVRDAVLVDLINDLGYVYSYVYSLYTSDLTEDDEYKNPDLKVDENLLLSIAYDYFSDYTFGEDIVQSVLDSSFRNEVVLPFDVDDGRLVVLDFLNFVAKTSNFDRVFTFKDLLDRYEENKHIKEMNQLYNFLNIVEIFERKLYEGESIEELYKNFADRHNLELNPRSGKYNYNEQTRPSKARAAMTVSDIEDTDKELYALAYAYAKQTGNEKSHIKLIDSKIREMKRC